ncbi:MAG TPA: glycosyltransferase family 2 protein [Phycisphaerales bacterium]|nr:glycosyltransferase family 2 protein [Phycisphaerales bacterium]
MAQPLAVISVPPGGSYTGPRPTVSVVVLTLNEANNIRECIASCAWCDDVHVLDSGSTDGTQLLAEQAGAKVWFNRFESFGKQRNWAIDNIRLKHDWVLHLDADERCTPELIAEIDAVLKGNPSEAGYYLANQMVLMGSWIRYASGYPAYQMRLFHKGRMRFTDVGHGQREATDGNIGTLRHPYVHLNFSKGLDDWFARHNRYSTLEAVEVVKMLAEPLALGDVLKGGIARRRALKRLAARLPMRGTLRLWMTLLVQRGVLDGAVGWRYAKMLAIYEGMIALKVKERRNA